MIRFAAIAASALAALAITTGASADHRNDCDAMRGTPYQHPGERDWFWSNCVLDVYGGGVPTGDHRVTATENAAPAGAVPDPAAAFAAGYADAGGDPALLAHITARVIPCESGYNPAAVNPAGPYYGLMQFSGATWAAAGGGDVFSSYQQGANTARLIGMAAPASQWPYCWFA